MCDENSSWLSSDDSRLGFVNEPSFASFLSDDEPVRKASLSTSFRRFRESSIISENAESEISSNHSSNEIDEDEGSENEENNYVKDSFLVSDSDSYYTPNNVSMASCNSPLDERIQPKRFAKVDLNAPSPSRGPIKQKPSSTKTQQKSKSVLHATVLTNVDSADERNLLLELYPELNSEESLCSSRNSEPSIQIVDQSYNISNNIEETVPEIELVDLTADSDGDFNQPDVSCRSEKNVHTHARETSKKYDSDSSDGDDAFEKYLQSLRGTSQAEQQSDAESVSSNSKGFVVSDNELSEEESYSDEEERFSEEESDYSDEEIIAPIEIPKKSRDVSTEKSIKKKTKNDDDYFVDSLSETFHGTRHPEASKYLGKHFKNKKTRDDLTETLFNLYKRLCFDNELPMTISDITWNSRLRKTAGLCRNSLMKKTSRIELSGKVCTTPDRLRDTLIHELCHAATWVMDGAFKAGHGPVWRRWAMKCIRVLPSLPNIERCHSYDIEAKYVYICNGCGQKVKRHSKSLDISKKICGRCHGHFVLTVRGKITGESQKKAPNKFAQFVKDNYGKYRTAGTSHREIMSILSAEWKTQMSAITDSASLDISVLTLDD